MVNTFRLVTPPGLFKGNTRIMDLEISKFFSKKYFIAAIGGSKGIRPISNGPDVYPSLVPGDVWWHP